MPPKKAKGALRPGVHPQYGAGFFDSVGNFFKKAASTVWNGVKKIPISRGLEAVGSITKIPQLKTAAEAARSVGLGKRKKKTGSKRKTGGARKGVTKMSGTGHKLGATML